MHSISAALCFISIMPQPKHMKVCMSSGCGQPCPVQLAWCTMLALCTPCMWLARFLHVAVEIRSSLRVLARSAALALVCHACVCLCVVAGMRILPCSAGWLVAAHVRGAATCAMCARLRMFYVIRGCVGLPLVLPWHVVGDGTATQQASGLLCHALAAWPWHSWEGVLRRRASPGLCWAGWAVQRPRCCLQHACGFVDA